MDYINTSHPKFIGGSKAVEIALQQVKSSRVSMPMPRSNSKVEKMSSFFICFGRYTFIGLSF